jgi:N utilization substance protein A
VANIDIIEALNEIARQKNLDREFVIEKLKEGLLQACKKRFGTADNIVVEIEDDTGDIGIFATKQVVEEVTNPALEISVEDAGEYLDEPKAGDTVELILPFEEFGRLAIQSTKQVLFQRIREAEREQVYSDFASRVGEIITGTVQQINRGDILVSLGHTEGILPFRDQIHAERYQQGRSIKAVVKEVNKTIKGPQIVLSRTSPDFVKKLFQQEVPEVREGLVEIKAVARDPGDRAKIAVYSKENKVDAVGACVGLKGVRVQAVVRELSGEKIDIVSWSPDPAMYVVRALAPAKSLEAFPDEDGKRITVISPDDQYSLAIGKKGQNVRLAVKLTGWNINVIAESEYQERLEAIAQTEIKLDELEISDKVKARLVEAGLDNAEKIIAAGEEGLTNLPGIGDKTAEKVLAVAKEAKDKQLMSLIEQPAAKDKRAAGHGSEQEAAAGNEEGDQGNDGGSQENSGDEPVAEQPKQ